MMKIAFKSIMKFAQKVVYQGRQKFSTFINGGLKADSEVGNVGIRN